MAANIELIHGQTMQAAQNNLGLFRVFKPTILFQAPALPAIQQLLLQPDLTTTAALWNYASITTAPPPPIPSHVPQMGYHEVPSTFAPVYNQHIITESPEQQNQHATLYQASNSTTNSGLLLSAGLSGFATVATFAPVYNQHIITETQEQLNQHATLYQANNMIQVQTECHDTTKHPSSQINNTSTTAAKATGNQFKPRKKKFPCPLCDIRCSNNGQLQGHMRIHTGERPFRCTFEGCDRRFARNEELTRHKRIHTGFRPHKCEMCEKAFGRKDHLNKHEKTHLQDAEKKVLTCLVSGCGERFSRSDALTRHQWTAHSILRPSRQAGGGRVKLELQEFQPTVVSLPLSPALRSDHESLADTVITNNAKIQDINTHIAVKDCLKGFGRKPMGREMFNKHIE